jgi:prephenate dehydratase
VEYTDVIFPESTREIHYLYTTKAVLEALQQGSIDYGQFALYNSIGGLVEETLCEL